MYLLKKLTNPDLGRVKRPGLKPYTLPGTPDVVIIAGKHIPDTGVEVTEMFIFRNFLAIIAHAKFGILQVEEGDTVLTLEDLKVLCRKHADAHVSPVAPTKAWMSEGVPVETVSPPPLPPKDPPKTTPKAEPSKKPEKVVEVKATPVAPKPEEVPASTDKKQEAPPAPVPTPVVEVKPAPEPVAEVVTSEPVPAKTVAPVAEEAVEEEPAELPPPPKPLNKMSKTELLDWLSTAFDRADLEQMTKAMLVAFAKQEMGA